MPQFSYYVLGGEEKKWKSFLSPLEKYLISQQQHEQNSFSSRIIRFVCNTDGEINGDDDASDQIHLPSADLVTTANTLFPTMKLLSITKEETDTTTTGESSNNNNNITFFWKPVLDEELFKQVLLLTDAGTTSSSSLPCLSSFVELIKNKIIETLSNDISSSSSVLQVKNLNSEQGWLTLQSRRRIDVFLAEKIITNTNSSSPTIQWFQPNKSDQVTTHSSTTILIKSNASCVVKGSHSMLHLEIPPQPSEKGNDDNNEEKLYKFIMSRSENSLQQQNVPIAPFPWVIQRTNYHQERSGDGENKQRQQQQQYMMKIFFVNGKIFSSIYHNELPKPQEVNLSSSSDASFEWKHSKTFFRKCPKFEAEKEEAKEYPFSSFCDDGGNPSNNNQQPQILCDGCHGLLFENQGLKNHILQIVEKISQELSLRLFGLDLVIDVDVDKMRRGEEQEKDNKETTNLRWKATMKQKSSDERLSLLLSIVDINCFPDYSGISPIERVFERVIS